MSLMPRPEGYFYTSEYKNRNQNNTGTTESNITGIYDSALQRWLKQQKESAGIWKTAEAPTAQKVNMFQPGGGYGAGQNVLIEDEARRAKAEALSNQVATGMSSGSLATSTGLRVGSDMTKAKLGVEDTRTQFLASALSELSGLRATRAGQVSSAQQPGFDSLISSLSNIFGVRQGSADSAAQLAAKISQANADRTSSENMNRANITSNEKIASMRTAPAAAVAVPRNFGSTSSSGSYVPPQTDFSFGQQGFGPKFQSPAETAAFMKQMES